MAKKRQQKKRNKKYHGGRAHSKVVRADYRGGGRVKLHAGKIVTTPEGEQFVQHNDADHTQDQHNPDGTYTAPPTQTPASTNIPGLPGYDPNLPTVYPTINIPGVTPAPADGAVPLWWETAGFATLQEALNAGWTVDTSCVPVAPTTADAGDSGLAIGDPDPNNTGLVWNGTAYVKPAGVGDTDVWNVNTGVWETQEQIAERVAAEAKAAEEAKKAALRQSIDDAAAGKVPTEAVLPKAIQVPEGVPQQTTTIDAPTTVQQRTAPGVAPEQVTTVDTTAQVQTPEQIQAAKMAATTISPDAQVEAATGAVSDEAVAKAAGVERVPTIQAADIEIPEGALTERVIGTLSPEAQSTAVMNVGSSLARVTRAKKQLANAGLSDADITELGNDPEALEDRLADFSEAERGIIEGLPEEALVSNQIDSLLKGIEEGEIPTWARPAVAAVESVLAQRGMSASTVGRDALLNAIIQSAMPIAQSNAQAIQASVSQQKTIEAQEAEANAARGQQTALTNASNVFQLNMAQFSADQQTALSNSKFLQTVGLTDASMEQQGIMQDAVMMAQANLAEADFNQRTQIQNAQAFLQMDLTNLSNEQQSNVLRSQQTQQRLLSNQSAQNASAQFNAASENQTNQFMSSLNAQINQFNAGQQNATAQFNATQANAAEARDAQREADVNKFNAQLATQVDQFNANQDFARNQWNAQNVAAVEASNVQWRRQTNVANTAAQNAVNMQNAQNAFAMSQTAQSFLWQELRDQADYDFRTGENERSRIAQLVNTALASDPSKYNSSLGNLQSLIGVITQDIIG